MKDRDSMGGSNGGRSVVKLTLLGLFMLFWFCAFVALGTWQVQRRAWKLDLIARIDHRIHATPVAPPLDPRMSLQEARSQEYLRVRTSGVFLNESETLTQAVSEFGPGYWVMTPLKSDSGTTILINRGFVDEDHAAHGRHSQPVGPVTVTGLLRPSEPHGGFLQTNQPARNSWHSRDVEEIAHARGLSSVPPYFIDAEAYADGNSYPRGGLTIISFPNNHLMYLITWYGLAILVLIAGGVVFRSERAARRSAADETSAR